MKRPLIAIDVDNTLLTGDTEHVVVSEPVRDFIRVIHALGVARILLWSGGGAGYAQAMARRCAIDHLIDIFGTKGDPRWAPDITLDDQEVTLGTVNLRLPGDVKPTPWMGLRG